MSILLFELSNIFGLTAYTWNLSGSVFLLLVRILIVHSNILFFNRC